MTDALGLLAVGAHRRQIEIVDGDVLIIPSGLCSDNPRVGVVGRVCDGDVDQLSLQRGAARHSGRAKRGAMLGIPRDLNIDNGSVGSLLGKERLALSRARSAFVGSVHNAEALIDIERVEHKGNVAIGCDSSERAVLLQKVASLRHPTAPRRRRPADRRCARASQTS